MCLSVLIKFIIHLSPVFHTSGSRIKETHAFLGGKIGLSLSDNQRSSEGGAVSHFSPFPLNFVRSMQGFAFQLFLQQQNGRTKAAAVRNTIE